MSEFLSSNAISYNKITVVGDNRIRFNKVDAQAGAANYEEAINRQTELYLKRVSQKNARGMLVRKYKLGELPDIQIAGKDIVDPMMLLAFNDSELASELFGLLF
jgi:DNA-dependent protein kinase catalytic subunit